MQPTDAHLSSPELAAVATGAGVDSALADVLFQTVAVGVGLIDRELRYVRVNEALAAMNGRPAAEHAGRAVREVLPPVAADALEPLLRRVIATGEPVLDLAFTARVPDRGTRDFVASYVPVRDERGVVTGAAAVVAERTPAEVALRETEGRLRRVAESGIVGLFFWRMDGGIIEANDAFLAMLGYTQEDLAAGRVDWRRMTPPEYAGIDEAAVQELLATGRHGQVAKEYVGKGGRRVPVVVTSALLDRSRDRGVCVCLDDTARRAAESRLGRVLMQTPAAVAVLLGPDHVVHSVNEMFLRLLGRRDYVGRPAREGAPELVEQGFVARMDEVYRTGVPYAGREAPLLWDRDGDGTLYEGYFDFVYQPLVDANGGVEGILVFAVEVTAQVLARRGTEDAARRIGQLQALTAALSQALATSEVIRIAVEQGVPALRADAWLMMLVDATGERLEAVSDQGYAGGLPPVLRRIPLTSDAPVAESVRTGRTLTYRSEEERTRRFPPAGPPLAEYEASVVLPLSVRGRALGALVVHRRSAAGLGDDAIAFMEAFARQCAQAFDRARAYESEQAARAEAEAAWRRAEHASREAEQANQAKSGFLATMSHELRTPLNAILGYAQLMDLGLAGPLTDAQRSYLDRLARSSHHLLGLVNDVLDLSKIEAGEIRVARVDAWTGGAVRAALTLVEPQAAAGGVRLVDARPDEEGVAYVGDDDRVRQIVLNLLSNAVKFTERGGTITVTCDTTHEAVPAAHLRGEGPWAYVRVEDTGVGIPAEEQSRIFEPFHQVESGHTRTAGGTGLGLAISRRLARLMGGDLTVDSTVGVGSEFTLWLPAADRASGQPTESAAARGARADQERAMFQAPGLSAVAEVLRASVDEILAAYVARLRVEPVPGVSGMRRLEIEDHAATMLADLAQSLDIIEGTGAEAATLLRDSSAIQLTIATAHGVRRHAQGWDEQMLRRDHEIMRAEVERVLRRRLRGAGADVDGPMRVLLGMMERAQAIGLRGWRQAAGLAQTGG
jgi:PAS domain S-box-containing protein